MRLPTPRRLVKYSTGSVLALAAVVAGCDQTLGPRGVQPDLSKERPSVYGVAPTPSRPAPVDVRIDNFSFTPPTVTVPAGTTVTWVNHDDVPHTVTADDRTFTSRALDTDDRYSRTFAAPGTYPYFCAVHPHMTGRVVVK